MKIIENKRKCLKISEWLYQAVYKLISIYECLINTKKMGGSDNDTQSVEGNSNANDITMVQEVIQNHSDMMELLLWFY